MNVGIQRASWVAGLGVVLVAGLGGCVSSSEGEETETLACGAKIEVRTNEGQQHVEGCSPVTYESNPPSSGNHYATWAAFGVYESPLPRGFWVHNLEHGAVVVTHNCTEACDDDIDKAKAWVESASEPNCPSAPRLLMTPDPLLDVEWAASAWGVTMTATCFDKATFASFFAKYSGKAPEDICAPGEDFRKPDGTLSVDPNCGK